MESTVNVSISLANRHDGTIIASPPQVSWTDQRVATKMRAVKNFIQKHSTELEQDPTQAPSWFSFVLNTFGDPAIFRDVNTGGVGAVDIAYTAAPFQLANDEALIIEGLMPTCKFANVVLWNRYLQTFDYVTHQTSLNRAKMISLTNQHEKIGQYSIILSHVRPSNKILQQYDWLDTMKKNGGTIFFRFLLPDGVVGRPKATVVKFHEIHV